MGYDSTMQLGKYKNKKNIGIVAGLLLVLVVSFIVKEIKAPGLAVSRKGDSGAPVVNMPVAGKIIKEKGSGKEFMSNQLIVEFKPDVTEAAALAIISLHGGKMLQRFTLAPVFLVQVDDTVDGSVARKVVAELSKLTEVKSAGLNYFTTIPKGK